MLHSEQTPDDFKPLVIKRTRRGGVGGGGGEGEGRGWDEGKEGRRKGQVRETGERKLENEGR